MYLGFGMKQLKRGCDFKKAALGFTLISLFGVNSSIWAGEDPPVGILGKDQWLFYRYEVSEPSDEEATLQTIDLIQRFSKILQSNGVTLAVAMVPIKMRVYAEHLPDDIKLNPFMANNYARMTSALSQHGVHVLDLNTPFLTSSLRNSTTPLFYRLDTHWSLTGAMVAAEAVKTGIETNPALRQLVSSLPPKEYNIAYGKRKIPSAGRDLIAQLPRNSIKFDYEQVTPISITAKQPSASGLTDAIVPPGIALLGSSYSKDWTGFPDGLRYMLQRDVLSMGVGADQGSWVGMEAYLRDDGFQLNPPKLLIWEMPERDMRAPPDYKYREARYRSKNADWLLRVATLAQKACDPAATAVRIVPAGLGTETVRGKEVHAKRTGDQDFVELEFDRPLSKFEYLNFRIGASDSRTMVLDAVTDIKSTKRFEFSAQGSDSTHPVKMPLPVDKGSVTRVRIVPGKTNGFSFEKPVICKLPQQDLY